MLCCRPRKDKYDLDDAENEQEKKDKQSKEEKKSKNIEKTGKTDKSQTKANNIEEKDKTEVVELVANLKEKAAPDDNDDIIFSEKKTGDQEIVVEENISESEVVAVEAGVSSGNNSENVEKQTGAVTEKEKNQSEVDKVIKTEPYRETDTVKSKSQLNENEPLNETKHNTNEISENKESNKSEIDNVVSTNVSSLQERSEVTSKADSSQTDSSLTEKTLTQSEEGGTEEEPVMSAVEMQAAISRLEAVALRLESLSQRAQGGGGGGGSSQAAPDVFAPFVIAFDDIMSGQFAKYLDISGKIGAEVQTQANMVKTGFQALRDFLVVVSKSKKPSQTDLVELLNPISNQIASVQEFREKNRGGKLFNHLSGISESIPALGWVTVEPTPGPFVKEMSDAGMFYTNRVVKEFKEVDQVHVDWTKAWLGTLRELQAYIKDHHTTGVSWNPQGGDAKSAAGAKAPPAPAGGPPPPPPGPPPPPPPPVVDMGAASDGGGEQDARAALFADLNKGESVTTGLKKVTDDMKTHKNPNLRVQSTVSGVRAGPAPFKAPAGPPKTAPKPKNAAAAKPPVFELQLKKWVIEYQIGNKTMVIDDTNLKQTVYMYKCEDSTLQIKGKINSITLDSCKKVAIAFDAVVSSIEFVNCQSIQAQVFGKCPTVSIDKTDGCQMYLSKDALEAEIVTAKSSEMNILVPKDDGDFEEYPLPEQYKTLWNGKKFVTGVAESV